MSTDHARRVVQRKQKPEKMARRRRCSRCVQHVKVLDLRDSIHRGELYASVLSREHAGSRRSERAEQTDASVAGHGSVADEQLV